ncbi:PLP-dependent transferase [Neolentinus lepideus HHB14362 ss-1]|uniref:PLP-dependent transferase n=1 Tax=Neolentinus lepideus HHB14362 ss-1 TaxID=1314782 RepID=A0A165NU10_9AGAM|nr:PLP-dependent transferase [Neolentinus lepideus HHB14362 ss-1]
MSPTLDIAAVRAQFPSLATGFVFAENAGGSQILGSCVDKITDYLINTNAQHGAGYEHSVKATDRVAQGKRAVAELFGVEGGDAEDQVVLGGSSTQLVENLARAIEQDIRPGEEIIVTGEHETNAGPWKKLAARTGAALHLWEHTPLPTSPANPYAVSLQIPALLPLISRTTRLVAISATSNLLGSVTDVAAVVTAVKEKAKALGARKVEVCVDCVAYAPHRRMEVERWGVDYAVFSLYKVYGPHVSALYIHPAALSTSLSSLAHHFLPDTVYKIQPGGPGYELAYSATALPAYLRSLSPARTLGASFALIQAHEEGLVRRLLGWLGAPGQWERSVRVVGEGLGDLGAEVGRRVPTVSFVVVGRRSADVVRVFDESGTVGIRYGHCYAYTLVERLSPKIDIDDAVVRISLVHYNTLEEVDKIIEVLDMALGS